MTLAVGGCQSHAARPIGNRALAGVRHFHLYTIFWVGPEFQGIPLTAADRPSDYVSELGMRVYYGDCVRRKGLFTTGGCTLPLEVNTVLYKPHSNTGLGPQRTTTIRGVPAVIFDGGRSVELYTGLLSVDVYASTPARALAAAQALRPLNATGPRVGRLLPPPQCPDECPPQVPYIAPVP